MGIIIGSMTGLPYHGSGLLIEHPKTCGAGSNHVSCMGWKRV